jgi:acetyl-CoA C-acetyltransferase
MSVLILSAKRLPGGAFMGQWSNTPAPELGAHVIGHLSTIKKPEKVYMGCVLQAGLGQSPARQSVIKSGLEESVHASTINKVCGSGMKAITIGVSDILLGKAQTVIAGGMENMSRSPYLLDKARSGYRMGHGKFIDHMLFDGLVDAYENVAMGVYADKTAEKYGFSRNEQEEFAAQTFANACHAQNKGFFNGEVIPQEGMENQDEPLLKVKPDKFKKLKPAFSTNGTVTAATSSSIADGAAGVLLAHENSLSRWQGDPLARIVGWQEFSQSPSWFTLAPIGAIQNLCREIGWSTQDVDLFEVNEAFAVVAMAAMKELSLPREKMNIHGGACALGHPIGVSGARIVVTLAHALKTHGLKKGIAAVCIGGGEGMALAIEAF